MFPVSQHHNINSMYNRINIMMLREKIHYADRAKGTQLSRKAVRGVGNMNYLD